MKRFQTYLFVILWLNKRVSVGGAIGAIVEFESGSKVESVLGFRFVCSIDQCSGDLETVVCSDSIDISLQKTSEEEWVLRFSVDLVSESPGNDCFDGDLVI